jgi:hypothetical protein
MEDDQLGITEGARDEAAPALCASRAKEITIKDH